MTPIEADPREQLERDQAECLALIDRLAQFDGCAFQLEFLGPGGAPVAVPEALQPDLLCWLVGRLVARHAECCEQPLPASTAPDPVEVPTPIEAPALASPAVTEQPPQVTAPVTEEPAVEDPVVDQVGEVSAASDEPAEDATAAAEAAEEPTQASAGE